MTARLQEFYQKNILPVLKKGLGLSNDLAVPRLVKVVAAMGVGKALEDKSELGKAMIDLSLITGQKPKVNKAKKSISSFKLQIGNEIGLTATLRGQRMYEFLDKVFNIVLPRTKDFKGVSKKSLDGQGNFSLGFSETTVFPEINPAKVDKLRGMQVTIVTTAKNNREAEVLLKALGCPFKKD